MDLKMECITWERIIKRFFMRYQVMIRKVLFSSLAITGKPVRKFKTKAWVKTIGFVGYATWEQVYNGIP